MSYKNNKSKKNKYNVRNIIHSTDEENDSKNEDLIYNKKFFINNIISNFFVIKKNIPESQKDCIGPCYPKNNFIYNPITFQLKKSDESNCPIKPYNDSNNEKINFKECNYKGDKDYLYFDVLNNNNPYLIISKNDDYFLKEIYNLNDLNQVYDFINNELNNLPIYSQKRIINAIFNTYIRDDLFPNNFYVNYIKNILLSIYQIKLSSEKILKNIIKIKNQDVIDIEDIFQFLFNKYSE